MTRKGFIPRQVDSPKVPEVIKQIPDPLELPRTPQQRPPTWVWMLVFVIAAVVLIVILFRTGTRLGGGAMFMAPLMLISMLGMMRNRSSNDKTRPAAIGQSRADYTRALDEVRVDVQENARLQAAEIAYHHPNPTTGSLLTLVNTGRMWERGVDDRNFGHVRIGVGLSKLAMTLEPPKKVPPAELRETITTVAMRDFLLAQNVVHDVARPIHLFDQMGYAFFAEPDQRATVQALLRAMVCQLATWHAPDVVRLAIVSDDGPSWEWAKWLPHVADRDFVDASGSGRLIFASVDDLMVRFTDLASRPDWAPRIKGGAAPSEWMVVVVDVPGGNVAPILGTMGHAGVSVLEATGDDHSPLATATTAFLVDDDGNLLRAEPESMVR
ncbi:cell division protein FtsK [Mycolicibacterium fallax]|uniref:Cell division protein FtsK n=1 Tax=Mycolicibacterium fallax TaxID=1793 RepID=A0A1X1RK31_MYCFA|nr:cell division protein FtsK [Mycolicibacterium fallax]ORV08023.1 cell division protein FtsK [Mycolicibacterium fallax]